MPFAKADVAIYALAPPRQIDQALPRLELAARDNGSAVATANVRPAAMARIAAWAKRLEARGFVLVPISHGRAEDEILRQDRVAADKETA